MSDTTITVASPPSTNDVAAQILATMAALSGVITDFNVGSQIRTQTESIGSVIEQQGVAAAALALQAFAFSALAAFQIEPAQATFAIGNLTISTAPTGVTAPPATQSVAIPAGTLVQTSGGIQAQTVGATVLSIGATGVTTSAIAVVGGIAGNVAAGAFNQIISGLGYPLSVTNSAAFTGGAPAETTSAALARFSAKVNSLGLASPVNIANAVIGVTASGTGESVLYAAVYEPWAAAGSGAGSGVAGFMLYIDNGSGAASSTLIAATTTALNGSQVLNESGYRPAGVPYSVLAVQPIFANVVITGASAAGSTGAAVSGAMVTAVQQYFTGLQFQASAEQPQIAAAASNAAPGLLTALAVSLFVSGSSTAVPLITGGPSNRVILAQVSVDINP